MPRGAMAMNFSVILLLVLSHAVSPFSFSPLLSKRNPGKVAPQLPLKRFVHFSPALNNKVASITNLFGVPPSKGELVLAEVEDIVQTEKEPVVLFTIKGSDGEPVSAKMSTRGLTPPERMTLQAGAVLQLQVSGVQGEDVTVSFIEGGSKPSQDIKDIKPTSGSSIEDDFENDIETPVMKPSPPRGSNKTPSKRPPTRTKASAPGPTLNTLKTGMKLEGVVVSSTAYASFINAGVYRKGKSDTYAPVNGMLHKSDITPETISQLKRRSDNSGVLDRGTIVTVYVKEVYKQSGKLTLTTDPGIDKTTIVEAKEQTKKDGNERRRARRLRRQLETIVAGDTVTGYVQRVINEGVLVTITSTGALNVTGLLGKRDLPKQFEVPPDLKDSFQSQLLAQDFLPDRPITCGVLKVGTNPNPNILYNMKLLFEEFRGEGDGDNLKIDDNVSAKKSASVEDEDDDEDDDEDEDEDEDDDDDEEEGEFVDQYAAEDKDDIDDDTQEIYDELRGNKPLMAVQDFFDWADIQDMIEEGSLSKAEIEKTLLKIGLKKGAKFLSVEQFSELIDNVQDIMDADVEGEVDDVPEPMLGDKKALLDKASAIMSKMNDAADVDDADAADDEVDEDEEELTKEIFLELTGGKDKISVQDFLKWDEMKEVIQEASIDQAIINVLIEEVGSSVNGSLDLQQFKDLIAMIEETVDALGDDGEMMEIEMDEDDEDEEDEEEDAGSTKVQAKKTETEMNIDDLALNVDDFDPNEDEEELTKEIFDELSGGKEKISVKAFLEWDEIVELKEEGSIDDTTIKALIKEVGSTMKGDLTLAQFSEILVNIDEASGDDDDEDEDEEEEEAAVVKVEAKKESSSEEGEGEGDEFDEEELTKEIFEELSGGTGKVSVETFLKWDEIAELSQDGYVDGATIKALIKEVGSTMKGDLTLSQFSDLIEAIDKAAGEEEEDGDEEEEEEEEEMSDEEEEEEEEMSDEEVMREVYAELAEDSDKVSLEAFMQWEEIQELLSDDMLDKATIVTIAKAMDVTTDLSFEQFTTLIGKIEDATEGEGGEDEEEEEEEVDVEELTAEIFEELSGGKEKVSVKTFLKWDEIQELTEDGYLNDATIKALVKEVGSTMTGDLDIDQFKQLLVNIDAAADEVESSMEEKEEEEEEEEAVVESKTESSEEEGEEFDEEELTKEIFEELSGGKEKVSVQTFLKWDEITELTQDGYVDDATIKALIKEVGSTMKGDLTIDQFKQLLVNIDATADEVESSMDDDEEEEGEEGEDRVAKIASTIDEIEEEETEDTEEMEEEMEGDLNDKEMVREVYDELKGKAKSLSIKALKGWEEVEEMLSEELLTATTLDILISEVTGKASPKTLSFDEFFSLLKVLDEASDLSEVESKGSVEGLDDEDDEDVDGVEQITNRIQDEGDEEPTDDELEALTRDIFDELKSASGKLSIKKFKTWDSIKDEIKNGLLSAQDVDDVLEEVGVSGSMTYDEFKECMDLLEEIMQDEDDDDAEDDEEDSGPPSITSGKGFGAPYTEAVKQEAKEIAKKEVIEAGGVVEEDDDEATEITRAIFDDLRGKKKTITVAQLKAWDELEEMIEDGSLKRSTLEKALVKVGSYDNQVVNFDQFMKIIDVIQKAVDIADIKLKDDDEDGVVTGLQTSKNGQVMSVDGVTDIADDSDNDYDEDEEFEEGGNFEELSEEEAAKEVFNELAVMMGGELKLPLQDFLQWEDVQELLEGGALSKDDLATAIEASGVNIDTLTDSALTFTMFYDLLQLIDEYVDQSKIPNHPDMIETEGLDEEEGETDGEEEEGEVEMGMDTVKKEKKVEIDGDDDEDEEEEDDDEDDDEDEEEAESASEAEVIEMFEELSKGKGYITEKALRKWDELQELVEAQLATDKVIDSYFVALDIQDGKVDFPMFQRFMAMLDKVMLDDSGNILGMDELDRAVDLDDDSTDE